MLVHQTLEFTSLLKNSSRSSPILVKCRARLAPSRPLKLQRRSLQLPRSTTPLDSTFLGSLLWQGRTALRDGLQCQPLQEQFLPPYKHGLLLAAWFHRSRWQAYRKPNFRRCRRRRRRSIGCPW